MSCICQILTVASDGVLVLRSPQLRSGDVVEVSVVLPAAQPAEADAGQKKSWSDFAGCCKGDCGSSNNELIDGDLAASYLDTHDPPDVETEESKTFTDWRQFAGIHKGDGGSSNNELIDADLADEYGSNHEPSK